MLYPNKLYNTIEVNSLSADSDYYSQVAIGKTYASTYKKA